MHHKQRQIASVLTQLDALAAGDGLRLVLILLRACELGVACLLHALLAGITIDLSEEI